MQSLRLIHSKNFPIARYADALLRESITPRALESLDQLTSDNGALRVVLVDASMNRNGGINDARTAIVGIGLPEQPKWLTDESIYFDLPENPSAIALMSAVKRAY